MSYIIVFCIATVHNMPNFEIVIFSALKEDGPNQSKPA